jgi:hypothetical protein
MHYECDASATFYPLSKGGYSPGIRGLGRDADCFDTKGSTSGYHSVTFKKKYINLRYFS